MNTAASGIAVSRSVPAQIKKEMPMDINGACIAFLIPSKALPQGQSASYRWFLWHYMDCIILKFMLKYQKLVV